MITHFCDLHIWQEGISLSNDIYDLTKRFPHDELYGLRSQMKRAVISVPSNIAERFVKRSNPDFRRFLSISLGSLAELETQIEIAKEQKYISEQGYHYTIEKITTLGKKTNSFRSKMQN